MNLTLNLNTKGTHMKTRTNKLATLLTAGLIAGASVTAHVAVVPVSFDLGSDPGKTTFQDAGFITAIPGNNSTITNVANGTRFSSSSNDRNLGMVRTFDGLGDGARNNFSINTSIYLDNFASFRPDLRHAAIVLFSPGTSEGDYITGDTGNSLAISLRSSDSGDEGTLYLGEGVRTGSPFATTTWDNVAGNDDPIARFDRFTFNVDVTFSGVDDMLVTATMTRTGGAGIGQSATVSHLFNNASDYIGGEYFGFGFRGGNSTRTDLESFAVIPEPGTLVLVGIALGSLLLFRRRR